MVLTEIVFHNIVVASEAYPHTRVTQPMKRDHVRPPPPFDEAAESW